MANIWRHLTSRSTAGPEVRLGLDELAGMYTQDNLLPWGMRNSYGNQETIENDFCGYVNGAYKASGVVFAVCLARMLIFSEMRFQYQYLTDGRPGDLFDRPSLKILEKPWPNGTTGDLLSRAIQDTDMCGNHYVVREGDRLRRLRPDWVDIILTAPPDKAVQSDVVGYMYRPGGTDNRELWKFYHVEGDQGAIAHWTPIPDPEAAYRGMSWLTPVLREIMQDKQATKHKLKFFENAATPNLAVSFKETVTAEQFKEFMRLMDESKHGVDHAYETLYLGGGADVTVVGSDIAQLDFKSTQGLTETRIAAAARVHPAIVGLSEGLAGSSLNEGNFRAAKDGFADGTLRPLWRSLCTAYAPLVEEFDQARLWYDTRDIEFLRQDRKDIAEIRNIDAQTIAQLVMNGYTPESVVESIEKQDLRLLKHTGLFSVQLQPPGQIGSGVATGQVPKGQEQDVAQAKKAVPPPKSSPKGVTK